MNVPTSSSPLSLTEAQELHQRACDLVRAGEYEAAQAIYPTLEETTFPADFYRLVKNNRAVLAAVSGERSSAIEQLQVTLTDDPAFSAARDNLQQLRADGASPATTGQRPPRPSSPSQRIVLLSFFFNWPSQAGGIVHTIELARFLSQVGYDVTLLHPQYAPWQIGHVGEDCPVPVQTVPFTDRNWNRADIQRRLREAVDRLNPESVIITDCWNFKPHLVEALSGYRVFLRMQAHECLCPLNNLRIKPQPGGGMTQCPIHQLVFRDQCLKCVGQYGAFSGSLHQQDRLLSEVDSPTYETVLRRALREAEAVLVLNPLIAETIRPYCRRVETVTWGMDPDRFPPPTFRRGSTPLRILFAGIPEEPIKGFDVLQSACRRLWQNRQDWELVVTGQSPGDPEPFVRYMGWQSQATLPGLYRDADIVAVPTLVQDGLSRTVVEGMAAGRAVVASRLGAMPFLISEGVTGLLCTAGDSDEWAATLSRLLDDAALREDLGRNGRQVFMERFVWNRVIQDQYRSLLSPQPA